VTALIATVFAATTKSSSNPLFSILVLVLPLGALFYLMIVPQRKQRAKQAEFMSKLGVGDEVVTSGGIYGVINDMEDGIAHLEIDTDVVIRVAVSALSRPATAPEPDSSADTIPNDDEGADKKKAQ
jgi:preprotein translocase subunit YajC